MATPSMDIYIQSKLLRLKEKFDDHFNSWPTFNEYYTHKYKGKPLLLIDSYYREKENHLNELARKYRGEFTARDFCLENWVRVSVLSLTPLFGFSRYSLSQDLSNAFRGMFSKFSSVYLRSAVFMQAPIMYAATNTNFDSPLSYFEFMIRSSILGALLFPL